MTFKFSLSKFCFVGRCYPIYATRLLESLVKFCVILIVTKSKKYGPIYNIALYHATLLRYFLDNCQKGSDKCQKRFECQKR